jgi:hypothetical protein
MSGRDLFSLSLVTGRKRLGEKKSFFTGVIRYRARSFFEKASENHNFICSQLVVIVYKQCGSFYREKR